MASGLEFTSYLLFLLCITSTSISLSLPPPEFTFSFFLFFSFLLSVLHFFFFFFVFLSFCFPFKMRVCGNPESIKALGAIFPTAWAHFASLCRMLVILAILQTSPFLGYLIWWSGVNDLGSTPKMHPNCLGEPPPQRGWQPSSINVRVLTAPPISRSGVSPSPPTSLSPETQQYWNEAKEQPCKWKEDSLGTADFWLSEEITVVSPTFTTTTLMSQPPAALRQEPPPARSRPLAECYKKKKKTFFSSKCFLIKACPFF